MTKYILNSGGLKVRDDCGKAFFDEIVSKLGAKPKLLMCFFGEKREEWEEKFVKYSIGFKKELSEKLDVRFELAFPDSFESQCNEADAIYIHGGDDYLLQYWLKQYQLPKIWQGKIVATNSAASSAMSVASWTCDWRKCIDGLAILPIKFIPHFGSTTYASNDPRGPIDWEAAKAELAAFGDRSLPIYAMPEGDYIVIED